MGIRKKFTDLLMKNGMTVGEYRAMGTTIWVSGHNLSGYMPETSPYITSSWESARDDRMEDISNWVSSLHDGLKTHKYFENGREEWTTDHVLVYFQDHNGIVEENGEQIVLTDNDEEILKEIAECDALLMELRNLEPGEEWFGTHKYTSEWIQKSDRAANDIPESAEGDELDDILQKLNEGGY